MKIVVIGGTGLIGAKVVDLLTESGHEAVAASPRLGINTITGEGLAEALVGASVLVDVSNAPSFEDHAVLEFFQTSTRNLLAAEAAAGVGHHVALSIVGVDRSPDNGYFRAKVAQEQLIASGPIPYSIVRAIEYGIGPDAINCSWATLARKYPLSGDRSIPTIDNATWRPTPAGACAARRFRVEVWKKTRTA